MSKIAKEVLSRLRMERKLTQQALAEEAKINVHTISRIERGEDRDIRQRTLTRLAETLAVSTEVLTGEMPLPEVAPKDLPWDRRSQLNVRVADKNRNAMTLVARRYGVTATQIIELAPLLFVWAAEASLQQRQERLLALERAMAAVESHRAQFQHLPTTAFENDDAQDWLRQEKWSIKQKDLFATQVEEDDHYVGEMRDYEDSTENPFVCFLCGLVAPLGRLSEFESWRPSGSPHYRVCPDEAGALVGNDRDRVDEILSGSVSLHDMPKELRGNDQVAARAEWVRQEAAKHRAKCLAELEELLPGAAGLDFGPEAHQ